MRLRFRSAASLDPELCLALPREAKGSILLCLLHGLLSLLRENNLNVGGVGHVRVDAAVGTVCAPALLLRAVRLRMHNHKLVRVQAARLTNRSRIQAKRDERRCERSVRGKNSIFPPVEPFR